MERWMNEIDGFNGWLEIMDEVDGRDGWTDVLDMVDCWNGWNVWLAHMNGIIGQD